MGRYLGIDYGEKRVGIAVSDPSGIIASALKTLQPASQKKLLRELEDLIKEFAAEKVIIGLPLTMKGTDSQKTTEVRDFAGKLAARIHVPVEFMDERLTSVFAHQTLHQMGKKPGKHKERVDQLAAQAILQLYLDREKREKTGE